MYRASTLLEYSSRRTRDIALLDRVYEHVSLPPVIVAAIDTPYVQRLRGLKQLGASSFLYPGAVHTRFEHSIGVAHLARQFLMTIASKQPELGIKQRDVEIAMMAGLLHDVGHGPFSHLFEDVITKRSGSRFVHEDMSEQIMQKLMKEDLGLDDDFINAAVALVRGGGKKSVLPPPPQKNVVSPQTLADSTHRSNISSTVPYWELISNKRNGMDVDRLDYLFRDSLCCFGKPTIDVRVNRLFNAARIVKVKAGKGKKSEGKVGDNDNDDDNMEYRLVFEGKMAVNIREVFGLRAALHKSVYQHHVVKAVGHMIGDCLAAAAPFFRVNGKTLVECTQDIEDFTLLGDWVLEAVGSDPNPNLADAKSILNRLRRRDLYSLAGSANIDEAKKQQRLTEDVILEMLTRTAKRMGIADFCADNVIVDVVVINHGKGDKDPLSYVDFFNPKDDDTILLSSAAVSTESDGARNSSSTNGNCTHNSSIFSPADHTRLFQLKGASPLLSPSSFEERTVMVFSKQRAMTGKVRAVFEAWRDSDDMRGLLYEGLSFHNPRA